MQFMTDVKPQIDQLVIENANRTGRKLQLILKVVLSKSTKDEESEHSSVTNGASVWD